MQPDLYAVILAGGGGTRFWPASRQALPKQFLPLAGGVPLLAATRARLGSLVPDERVLVVASESQAALVRETLPTLPAENLLLEPAGRNTLPAIALAAAELGRRDPDGVQVVLPADHIISPEDIYRASLGAALEAAASGRLVTFGVEPTWAATGYGYIEKGDLLGQHGEFSSFEVDAFHEKPDPDRAEAYLSTGKHLWNSGMFVWSNTAIITALESLAPQTWSCISTASGAALARAYGEVQAQPVDVGIMEQAPNRAVIPVNYTWSDVGTWNAVADAADEVEGNVLLGGGELHTRDARGNVAWADPGTLISLIGVEDLVIVRAGDAVLVCPRSRSEEVKHLVEDLPEANR